jgi:RNA polymerase primary sigma factor
MSEKKLSPAAQRLADEIKEEYGVDEDRHAEVQEKLDDLVHDAKGEEATDINNGGVENQLRYLLEDRELEEQTLKDIRKELELDEDEDEDLDDEDEDEEDSEDSDEEKA